MAAGAYAITAGTGFVVPPLTSCRVLCLASGGGQQGPILSAAGANVTVFDASEKQLLQDWMVADRDGLEL